MEAFKKDKKYSPRELMERAYQLSLASIGEHEDKPDPLVGAILATKEGKILAEASRGELRIGEHCEFTLIERKLKSENLADKVLYVTLEPCIDAVRTKPKRGCATHIIKSRIHKVYIGMRDPDIDIENQGANQLIDAEVIVEDFYPDISKKIRDSLTEFIEYKEAEKLRIQQEKPKEKKTPYLKEVVPGTKIEQFSNLAIKKFIKNSNANFTYPSEAFNIWAVSFGLANQQENIITPTNIGLIVFGEKVDEVLPHTLFKVEIEYPDGATEIKDIGGAVAMQLEKVFSFVNDKALKLTIDRSTAKRSASADFPLEILREAIANAIIHRDYSITSSTNYLFISKDKIVIKSPGLPMPPLTLKDIRSLDLPSVSRNPKVMYVYNRMGLAEQRGIGLRSMKSLSNKGFPLPVIDLKGNVLEISFARNVDALPNILVDNIKGLSEQDKSGVQFIQTREEITVNEYAEEFKLEKKTAQRRLSDLVDKGVIVKEGERRWTKYRLKK